MPLACGHGSVEEKRGKRRREEEEKKKREGRAFVLRHTDSQGR